MGEKRKVYLWQKRKGETSIIKLGIIDGEENYNEFVKEFNDLVFEKFHKICFSDFSIIFKTPGRKVSKARITKFLNYFRLDDKFANWTDDMESSYISEMEYTSVLNDPETYNKPLRKLLSISGIDPNSKLTAGTKVTYEGMEYIIDVFTVIDKYGTSYERFVFVPNTDKYKPYIDAHF